MEKADERGSGKIECAAGSDTPNGGTHGHEIEAQEIVTEAMATDEFVERHLLERLVVQGGIGHAEEAHDLREKFEKTRTDEIGPLGKDAVESHPVVFDVEFVVAHAEAHFRRLDRDAQLVKQADQIRVGHFVEDHEPGIDRHAASVFIDLDRVGVAADVAFALENRHVVAVAQQPRCTEPGNATADDGQAFFAHFVKCSVGVPADESVVIGAGDGAATWGTLTLKPARRSAPPRGKPTRARGAGF